MKFENTDSNEIRVRVEPGETLYFGAGFLRSPVFSRDLVPHGWSRLLPDAFLGRFFAGKLWDLYVRAGQEAETVLLGGDEPTARFVVVEVEAQKKLFVRLKHVAAYTFGHGGGFASSWNPVSASRWLLRAVSAVTIRGPATLVFYGNDLKADTLEPGGHSFADQLLAFDATAPFSLHGLLPEGPSPAGHWFEALSTIVNVEFQQGGTVVKKTRRQGQTNRLANLGQLLFVGLLLGWGIEKLVMNPPVPAPPPAIVEASTGQVSNCEFPKPENFRSKHGEGSLSVEALVAKNVHSVGLERLALVQGTRAMWWLPQLTGNKLHDDREGTLVTLFSDAYKSIDADPGFRNVKSAMPWCIAGVGTGTGNGFVYVPDSKRREAGNTEHPAIVFLHGYGGSLLWNLWALKSLFPDHVILMPSGGIQWEDQDSDAVQQYVENMLAAAKTNLSVTVGRPWLFALSQGGPTAFRLASSHPNKFRGLVAFATWAEKPEGLSMNSRFPILMVNGDKDERVTIEEAKRTEKALKGKGASLELRVLEGADHFFFLSQREELRPIVGDFMRLNSYSEPKHVVRKPSASDSQIAASSMRAVINQAFHELKHVSAQSQLNRSKMSPGSAREKESELLRACLAATEQIDATACPEEFRNAFTEYKRALSHALSTRLSRSEEELNLLLGKSVFEAITPFGLMGSKATDAVNEFSKKQVAAITECLSRLKVLNKIAVRLGSKPVEELQ